MKLCVFIMIFSLPFNSTGADVFLTQIRDLYVRAAQNEKSCEELLKSLESYNENNNPLYAGYKAAATMLMAKYVFNPISKLNYFKKGKNLLEKTIGKDPNNIELRFIRHTIQLNAPSFLNYNAQLKNDRTFLIQHTGSLKDVQLKYNILELFKNDNSINSAEKKQLGL